MIISELKKAFAKRIHADTGVEFNLTKREQNIVYPCFFCEFVGSETKSVAGIDYLNIYDFDLWYYSKTTNPAEIEQIISQLNNVKSFLYNDKKIIIENLDINIYDDLLIYKVRFLVNVDEIEEIEPTLSSVKLIKKELETIANCSVYYLNGNLKDLEKGFFIIEPSKTSTESNSINGFKDFEREIVLRYVTSNKKLDIYGSLEDTTIKLINKLKGKNGIYSINFELDISYNEEEFNNIKVINHELTLLYTERKKLWI